ncbi:MAG: hypothetical protein QM696_03370 [Steroidobacteraceae bacterium]
MQSIFLRSLLCSIALSLAACQKAPQADTPAAEAQASEAESSVTLKPDEVQRMGIQTVAAAATTFVPEGAGYAQVIGHDTLAQVVAELATADAAVRQSQAVVARAQQLAGSPGALPAETLEAAQRQAAADAASLSLAERRLSTAVGSRPAWGPSQAESMLERLASGRTKLLRATFPLGLRGPAPQYLRFSPLDTGSAPQSWSSPRVWDAPADPSVPGRSFFALLDTSQIGEGERLQAWIPTGDPAAGVLIPNAAVLIHEGRIWCYVEREPGHFERVAVDGSQPRADGYLIHEGVQAGDLLVTSSAGLLLAREINPSTEAE